MKQFEQLELNDCVLSSESRQSQTPRGTRLTAHRSIGAALHTLDHQFSKSRHRKTSWQDYNANPASRPGSRGRPTWRYARWGRFQDKRARSTRIGLGRVISLASRGLRPRHRVLPAGGEGDDDVHGGAAARDRRGKRARIEPRRDGAARVVVQRRAGRNRERVRSRPPGPRGRAVDAPVPRRERLVPLDRAGDVGGEARAPRLHVARPAAVAVHLVPPEGSLTVLERGGIPARHPGPVARGRGRLPRYREDAYQRQVGEDPLDRVVGDRLSGVEDVDRPADGVGFEGPREDAAAEVEPYRGGHAVAISIGRRRGGAGGHALRRTAQRHRPGWRDGAIARDAARRGAAGL